MARRRDISRKVGRRAPKKKFYVFCEGQNTEPRYIQAYEREVSSVVLEIEVQPERGTPETLLRPARAKLDDVKSRRYRREFGDGDQVWVVFDRDEHANVPQVLTTCAQIGIRTAYSNPCFEVWLILHHEDYDKAEHRRLTQKRCEAVCDGYDRRSRKTPNIAKLLASIEDAECRAEAMRRRREQAGGEVPFTSVYELTRAMRGQT